MKIHRFYYPLPLSNKKIIINDKEIIHQIKNVLRLQKGDEIILFNEKIEKLGRIDLISKDFLKIILEKEVDSLKEPDSYVCLFSSILKRENFELLVEKATEIGIREIYPLICQRTVKLNFKKERMEKIIKEATEQSGRKSLLMVHPPLSFEEGLNLVNKDELNLFFDKEGEIFNKALNKINSFSKVNIFIGPEGGWTEEEKMKAKKNNFLIIKLSDLILRSETAGIVGGYLSVYLKELFKK